MKFLIYGGGLLPPNIGKKKGGGVLKLVGGSWL